MPAMIKRFHPGPRYSEMVVHRGVAHLAGQVPDDAQADLPTQCLQVFAAIDRLLAEAGTSRANLLMATVYLSDLADYDGFNACWDAWLAGSAAPPRATVQAQLAVAGWRLEITVTAAVD
jgi:enamine deaminase RidA (YjgF/YER057c/UK114 family)